MLVCIRLSAFACLHSLACICLHLLICHRGGAPLRPNRGGTLASWLAGWQACLFDWCLVGQLACVFLSMCSCAAHCNVVQCVRSFVMLADWTGIRSFVLSSAQFWLGLLAFACQHSLPTVSIACLHSLVCICFALACLSSPVYIRLLAFADLHTFAYIRLLALAS